jgi:hypothetical protein
MLPREHKKLVEKTLEMRMGNVNFHAIIYRTVSI